MAEIESNIRFNVDTSDAMASIKALQAQISAFQRQMASSSAANAESARKLRRGLIDDLNATGQWSASIKSIESSSDSFTRSLEKNKLSMGEYFRYAGSQTTTFGRLFTSEFNTIEKVARERVKTLQTQYISLGRDANGALKAIAVRPLRLDMNDLATQTAMNAQKQQIFNQLLKQGSTNLLNFGKNTQWAGRQLMVGFTVPLSIFGSMASKTFMQLEEQAIRFKRVYGELFTPPEEADEMLETLKELGKEFTKYGVAVEKTLGLAADAAAMGKTGVELLDQVTEANRLAVLGNVEQAQALETTISITNAFGVATEDLAKKIDFLNAVENQTVTSIEDLTIAVPKAGPVIQQLGGNVEDLAFFLTAMKEGGINASEGANALKSGLASLINPTGVAAEMLKTFGINIKEITAANRGDVKGLVIDFAQALDELNPSQRAQAIEQLFGKFQFSRLSTLFQNVIQDGTQAQRVLEITNATTQELAQLSNRELKRVEESTTFRFKKAVEEFQLAIAPVGEEFLKLITPIIEFATKIIEKFNGLSDGAKSFITGLTVLFGAIGPVAIMTFGLLANGIANIIKGFTFIRELFMKTGKQSTVLGEQLDYMTTEQLNAAAVAASLEQVHQNLIQVFSTEAGAVQRLGDVYRQAFNEQQRFDTGRNIARQAGLRLANGITSVPGPRGAGDIVPAVLSPGEAVIPADMARKYAPIIQGMIAGNLPGFAKGVFLGMPRSGKSTQKNREAADQIYEMFLQSSYRDVPPTEYGHQLAKTSGHSFPIFGLGGVYMGPNGKKVFVKPVMDEKAALAEMRATEIARRAHGLKAPEQRIVVMRDPMDTTRQRRFLALESALDATFVNDQPMAMFNEEQYFKQLVASLVRVDKDLSASNVFGDVVADVGPAGVFSRASGLRDYAEALPSMEEQAMINLLGIKGGAKKAFAEATVGLMNNMTPQQYHQKMIGEISRVLPLLEQTVASFKLSSPQEAKAYQDMINRLRQGLSVDWSKFHAIHSAVKPSKPKQSNVPGYEKGTMNVPGPRGAGDIFPAMLAPGEAVIPAAKAKKYAPIIRAIFADDYPGLKKMLGATVPGFEDGTLGAARAAYSEEIALFPELGDVIEKVITDLEGSGKKLSQSGVFKELENSIKPLIKMIRSTVAYNEPKGVSAKSNSGANLSHLVPYMQLSPEQAQQAGKDLMAAGTNTRAARFLATADRPVKAVSNLVASLPRAANDPSGSMSAAETARWIQEEKERFTSFIYENYAKGRGVEPNDPELMKFASSIADAMEKAGSDAMDDPQLYSVVKDAIANMVEGAAKDAVVQAASEFSTVEIKGRREPIGGKKALTPVGARTSIADGQGFIADSVGVINAEAKSYREYGRSAAGRPIIAQQDAQADQFQVKIIRERIANTLKEGLGINSPSAEYEAISNSVTQGVRQGTDDAIKAGAQIGEAIADGAAATAGREPRRASRAQTDLSKIPGGRQSERTPNNVRRSASRPGTKEAREAAEEQARLSQSTQLAADAMENAAEATVNTSAKLDRMNSFLMQGSFALTSLAGVGAMFGGTIGEISQMIFQLSGGIFALMQITQLLTQTKMLELIQTRAKLASDALSAAADAGKFAATNFFTGSMLRAGIAVNAFLGPVGWVILGLTALAGVIALIIGAQEEQKKKINGLGDAAFLTSEKLKKAGDLLGFTAKTTPFGQNITQGTAAARGAEEASMIDTLRSSEDFKTTYSADIEAIKNATKDQAEAVLTSVSNQLFSAGASQEQVDAYVRAIAQEAGRRDLTFSFAKIDFAKDGASQIVEAARAASTTYATTFDKNIKVYFDRRGNLLPDMTDYGKEGLQGVKTFAGSLASSFQSLKDGLANGLINAKQFQEGLTGVVDTLKQLDEGQLDLVLPDLYKKLGIEDLMSQIPLVSDQILLLQADAAGIEIPEFQKDALKNADKGARAAQTAARARAEITKKVREQATEQEKLNKKIEEEAIINEKIAGANVSLLERTEGLREQSTAYQVLVDKGYDAATAFELAGDSSLAAGIAAAQAAGLATGEWGDLEDILKNIEAYQKALANAPKDTTSGGGDKSPFEEAIDSLKEQRKELLESGVAFTKLRQAGFDTASAMKAAEDPILAAAIATTKVGTKNWIDLINRIKETQRLLSKKEMQDLLRGGKVEIANRRAQAAVSNALTTLGYTAEQIDQVLSDQEFTNTLAKDLADGKINAKEVFQRLAQIKQLGKIDVEIALSTKEGAAEEFQKRYDKVVQFLEAKKQTIEIDFQIDTFDENIIIRDAEQAIALINDKIDDYEAQLVGIEEQENVINEAYDERKKALDEVSKANDIIARQQKNQLTLADALSQGDIAAAAKAAQEMRAQSAQDSLTKQGDLLELSKEQQLANVRSADGRSRKTIENDIKKLKQDIFKIEEETLEPARQRIRDAEYEKQIKLDSLNQQILKWEQLSAKVNEAKLKLTKEEMDAMEYQAKLISDLLDKWDNLSDRQVTLTVIKKTINGDDTQEDTKNDKPTTKPTTTTTTTTTTSTSSSSSTKDKDPGPMPPYSPGNNKKWQLVNNKWTAVDATVKPAQTSTTKTSAPSTSTKEKAPTTTQPSSPVIKPGTEGPVVKALQDSGKAVSDFANSVAKGVGDFLGWISGANIKKASGGMIKRYASGGFALGTDIVPAMLTPGEFVVRKYAVDNFGADRLKAINNGTYKGETVYNYEVNVNVQTNSDPNQIATAVVGRIKQIESQKIRGNRF